MKKIFLIILILYSTSFSTTTYYDSIGTGKTYSTISAWEADTDNDLVSADQIRIGVLCGNETLSGTLTIGGATTDINRYRMLTAKAGNYFDGTEGSGYIITCNTSYDFIVQENYFKMKYLEVDGAGATRGDMACNVKNCSNTEFWYCFFHDFDEWGFRYEGTTAATYDHYIINCVVEDCNYAGVYADNYNVHIYNCVFYNNSDNDANYGQICTEDGRIGVVNTIAVTDNPTWYNNDFKRRSGYTGYYLDETRNNISSDATALGGFSVKSIDNDSLFTSITEGSMNFHLKSTLKTRKFAIDKGWYVNKLLTAFTKDIDDSTRSSQAGSNPDIFTWDIGIDETSIDALPQTVRYVRKLANAGTDWVGLTPKYGTIDSAISACEDFDVIYVASGRYVENIRCSKENIFLYGGFAGTEDGLASRQSRQQFMFSEPSLFTIIDANDDTNCFRTRSGVVLDGFHLRNGNAIRGAGFCAFQEGSWSYDQTYSTIRNCRIDSCRSTMATGWGAAVFIDNGPSTGVISAEFCFASVCSAYCGAFEVMSGSETAGQFINCMAYDCDAFGFEISVKSWGYFDDTDNSPGDCWYGHQITGAPAICLGDSLPWCKSMNHKIINCISIACPGNHTRGSIPYDPNYQSWAKDRRYMSHCFAGASGIVWGDTSTQEPALGAGVFWSMFSEVDGLIHQDSLTNKKLYFADSLNGDWRPTGASPFAKGGAGGEYASYMGVLPPIQGVMTKISPMFMKK